MIRIEDLHVEIGEKAIEEGMLTLRMAAVDKMIKGIISYEEVLAITN